MLCTLTPLHLEGLGPFAEVQGGGRWDQGVFRGRHKHTPMLKWIQGWKSG